MQFKWVTLTPISLHIEILKIKKKNTVATSTFTNFNL